MANQKWNGGSGDYSDPAQWTPGNVPLYGEGTTASIETGTAVLHNAEPNGITMTLGGASDPELMLDNAALGPSMTLGTIGTATLGIRGYDTNYGQVTLGGTLFVDTGDTGQLNQNGTVTVPTGSELWVGPRGLLNNIGVIDFTGGTGVIADAIGGDGTIDLAAATSSLELAGAVGADQTFAIEQGSLRIDNLNTFKGKLANFASTAASVTLGQIRFTYAVYLKVADGAQLVLTNNNEIVGQIALADTAATNYAVTANADGTSTITPVATPPTQTFTDGSIPSVIESGVVIIRNAEPNGQFVQFGASNASLQPELILDNAALGSQLTLSLLSPAGIAFASYATIGVRGYDTINTTIYLGGRPVTPQFLTVALGPYGQLNQFGTINVFDGSGLMVQSDDASAPGTLNNGGLINLGGGNATIMADIIGSGTIRMNFLSNVGSSTVELGGSVAPGQTIEINDGRLQLDDPTKFFGDIKDFSGLTPGLTLRNTQADAVQYQPAGADFGRLVLTSKGSVVDSFALRGRVPTSGYDVSYNAVSNTTTVLPHVPAPLG